MTIQTETGETVLGAWINANAATRDAPEFMDESTMNAMSSTPTDSERGREAVCAIAAAVLLSRNLEDDDHDTVEAIWYAASRAVFRAVTGIGNEERIAHELSPEHFETLAREIACIREIDSHPIEVVNLVGSIAVHIDDHRELLATPGWEGVTKILPAYVEDWSNGHQVFHDEDTPIEWTGNVEQDVEIWKAAVRSILARYR